jgi:hypothetical protein
MAMVSLWAVADEYKVLRRVSHHVRGNVKVLDELLNVPRFCYR